MSTSPTTMWGTRTALRPYMSKARPIRLMKAPSKNPFTFRPPSHRRRAVRSALSPIVSTAAWLENHCCESEQGYRPTRVMLLISRDPARPPVMGLAVSGFFVLTVGAPGLEGLTALVGGDPVAGSRIRSRCSRSGWLSPRSAYRVGPLSKGNSASSVVTILAQSALTEQTVKGALGALQTVLGYGGTIAFAISQLQVAYLGGPERPCLFERRPQTEWGSTVRRASPAIKTRSLLRKKATWPGVWPGVGMHSQSGRPVTPGC
jgi:hypothetical protein